MKIHYNCPPCSVCGNSAELLLEEESLISWHYGQFIQDAFPDLNADQRELIMTGTHVDCWDLLFEGVN